MNKYLKEEINASNDGDIWGSSLVWHFAICDTLYTHGGEIPKIWQYKPSPFLTDHVDEDDYNRRVIEQLLQDNYITLDELTYIGNILNRYENILITKELNY